MFRFETRKMYEEELQYRGIVMFGFDSQDYDELVDEYIKFCEVSGSGE